MHKVEFVLEFETEKEAKIIFNSLYPEIKHRIPKTMVETKLSKSKIFLTICANTTSSLRAACNSYLRWIKTAVDVKDKISK
ncbi:MAG: hypothetical protein J7J89_02945 [Thermoplasmata archaeon]|nr:hypothetical protein [Thermoplasmata archaeon]